MSTYPTSLLRTLRGARALRLFALAALTGLSLLCTKDYNPFVDPSNARVEVIDKTFGTVDEADSICIFSAETLIVVAAARELLDSFSIAITHNRYDSFYIWKAGASSWEDTRFMFIFSLVDTGVASISITSYRSKGDEVLNSQFTLRAYSPLNQQALAGNVADRVHLQTDTVLDRDVLYHWQIGGREIVSPTAALDTTLSGLDSLSGTGRLWVSDVHNVKRSTSVTFGYAFTDTTGPEIRLFGGDKDTITTGDPVYRLKLEITDAGTGVVSDAVVDGVPMISGIGNTFTANITGLAGLEKDQAKVLTVTARDGQGTSSTRLFYLLPNEQRANSLIFTILSPTGERVWGTNVVPVAGEVESYSGDAFTARLSLLVNGVANPDTLVKTGTGRVPFQWSLRLDRAVNTVVVSAYDMNSNSITDTLLTILFDSTAQDVAPPIIADVTVNGASVGSQTRTFTPFDSVTLRIIAFDEGSGIQSLSVNGAALAPESDTTPFLWSCRRQARHTMVQPSDTILAVDNAGHSTVMGIRIFGNRPPSLSRGLEGAWYVGREYRSTLYTDDPDGDPVTVSKLSGPAGFTIAGDVAVWTPLPQDTGYRTIVLRLYDGYETVDNTNVIRVGTVVNARCSLSVTPRRGLIVANTLTMAEAADPDTLDFLIHDPDLSADEEYTAYIRYGGTALTKQMDTSRSFEVAVDPRNMTSNQERLVVIVNDKAGHRDTVDLTLLRAQTLVVPYRLRCTISFAGMTTPPGYDVYAFPALVRLNSKNFDFTKTTGSGGFRVTKANGAAMPYEIERWEPDSQRAEIWVLIDTVYALRTNQYFNLIWDPTLPGSTSQPDQVFRTSNSYAGEWHLGDGQAGAAGSRVHKDATANRNDGAYFADAPAVSGAIGRGQQFDGVNDYLSVPDASSLRPQVFTIMFWYYAPTAFQSQTFLAKPCASPGSSGRGSSSYRLACDNAGELSLSATFGGTSFTEPSGSKSPSGAWTHFTASYDGNTIYLYVNGENVAENDRSGVVAYDAHALLFGADTSSGTGPTGASPFRGILDEISISGIRRTTTWVRMTYANQKPGSGFVTVGPENVTPIDPIPGGTFKIGDTLSHIGSTDGNNAGKFIGVRAQLSKTATIQSMSMYVAAAAGRVRMGIYDNTTTGTGGGGQPRTLMAQTSEFTPTVGWNTKPVVSQISLPAGTYWICIEQSDNRLYYGAGDAGVVRWANMVPYGTLPATAPSTPNMDDISWSFYATMR